MNLLTRELYLWKIKKINDPYWNRSIEKRWAYLKYVLKEIKELNPKSVLEIGPNRICLTDESDVLDRTPKAFDLEVKKGTLYIHDALNLPWPIIDKKYDLVIATQVFEHLSPKQQEIFQEIKRISNYCILSLPYEIPKKNRRLSRGDRFKSNKRMDFAKSLYILSST